MSANDIEKGTRWRSGLANELEQASVSIICLTPENLEAPWIHFEAGALSKQQQNTYVCTFLFGLEPIDIREPLAQFQATKAEKDDTLKLIHTINRVQGDAALPEGKINEAFDVWWTKLEQRLNSIQKPVNKLNQQVSSEPTPQEGLEHQRDIREILSEILELVRDQARIGGTYMSDARAASKSRAPNLSSEDWQRFANYYDLPIELVMKGLIINDRTLKVLNDIKEAEAQGLPMPKALGRQRKSSSTKQKGGSK
jgi:hypothetical protein